MRHFQTASHLCLVFAFAALSACAKHPAPDMAGGEEPAAPASCQHDPRWGSFPTPALYRDKGDGVVDILLEEFRFVDTSGKGWIARKNLEWDGASIPRSLWTVAGSPKTGCHKLPSITHDEYYKHHADHSETRQAVDQMFYEGCRANGVGGAKAKAMYYALRWFGERWTDDLAENTMVDQAEQERFLLRLERHLEANDIELETMETLQPAALAAMLEANG